MKVGDRVRIIGKIETEHSLISWEKFLKRFDKMNIKFNGYGEIRCVGSDWVNVKVDGLHSTFTFDKSDLLCENWIDKRLFVL